MSTIQITLTVEERGDQDWSHVLGAIQHCAPANHLLKVRDGLSAPISTYANGFHVAIDVLPAPPRPLFCDRADCLLYGPHTHENPEDAA